MQGGEEVVLKPILRYGARSDDGGGGCGLVCDVRLQYVSFRCRYLSSVSRSSFLLSLVLFLRFGIFFCAYLSLGPYELLLLGWRYRLLSCLSQRQHSILKNLFGLVVAVVPNVRSLASYVSMFGFVTIKKAKICILNSLMMLLNFIIIFVRAYNR